MRTFSNKFALKAPGMMSIIEFCLATYGDRNCYHVVSAKVTKLAKF
jgi:hypothetical protein